MAYKRRRDRWRKLPTKRMERPGYGVHRGPFMPTPKVPGGVEMGVSSTGEVLENRPWSPLKWLILFVVGVLAVLFFWPFLFVGPMWFALAAALAGLIWKTWHDYLSES